FRKGQRYGTILVDLEQRRVIDLLPDREGSTFERWLKSHPEVELITRDRALAYADGATKGAPQAVQVADRFHLIKNLVEAFENLARRHSSTLREAALEVSTRRHHHSDVTRPGPGVWPGMKNPGNSNGLGCPTVRSRAEPECVERRCESSFARNRSRSEWPPRHAVR